MKKYLGQGIAQQLGQATGLDGRYGGSRLRPGVSSLRRVGFLLFL